MPKTNETLTSDTSLELSQTTKLVLDSQQYMGQAHILLDENVRQDI